MATPRQCLTLLNARSTALRPCRHRNRTPAGVHQYVHDLSCWRPDRIVAGSQLRFPPRNSSRIAAEEYTLSARTRSGLRRGGRRAASARRPRRAPWASSVNLPSDPRFPTRLDHDRCRRWPDGLSWSTRPETGRSRDRPAPNSSSTGQRRSRHHNESWRRADEPARSSNRPRPPNRGFQSHPPTRSATNRTPRAGPATGSGPQAEQHSLHRQAIIGEVSSRTTFGPELVADQTGGCTVLQTIWRRYVQRMPAVRPSLCLDRVTTRRADLPAAGPLSAIRTDEVVA